MSEEHRTRDEIARIIASECSAPPLVLPHHLVIADALLAAGFVILPPGMTAERLNAIADDYGRGATNIRVRENVGWLRSWAAAVSSRLPEPPPAKRDQLAEWLASRDISDDRLSATTYLEEADELLAFLDAARLSVPDPPTKGRE